VDLNPTGATDSVAFGVSGGNQVGFGRGPEFGGGHALLWNGTAKSVVDLNPAGVQGSVAFGVSGGRQVGFGEGPVFGGYAHAFLWSGTAASVVDLHPYLSGLGLAFTSSYATAIADNVAIVGYPRISFHDYAVMWTPIPEPSTAVPFCCGICVAIVARWRQKTIL
jgi:hypothetical protein